MAQVFISHSKKDQELINNVATMLKNVDEEPVVMEYMPKTARDRPNWSLIRKHVSESDYLMLFKTDNAITTDFTKSWIIYEVGLAAAYEKKLFVFERKGPPIKFPIPYVTDYMIFDPSKVKDFLTIQSIVAGSKKSGKMNRIYEDAYKDTNLLAPQMKTMEYIIDAFSGNMFPGGRRPKTDGDITITCPRCKTKFRYYSRERFPFNCPVCLTGIRSPDQAKGKERRAA